jgi:hypothetical protein
MAQQRPPAVTAMGILNLVFGGLGLVGLAVGGGILLLVGLLLLNAPAPAGQPTPADAFKLADERAPSLKYYFGYAALSGAVLAAVLTWSGVRLLQMRRSGRTLSLVYAVVSLVNAAGSAAYSGLVATPAMGHAITTLQERAVERERARGRVVTPPPPHPFTDPTLGTLCAVLGAAGAAVYPVALLVVMNLRQVREAFARPGDRQEIEPPLPEVHPT